MEEGDLCAREGGLPLTQKNIGNTTERELLMCWHKWSKWEQYRWEGKRQANFTSLEMLLPCSENRQRRRCLKCNKVEDELI